jgi:hypothetical protein
MVRGTVDGVGVWRQPSRINEYNPEGITLAVVDHELADAKIVKEDKDWKVIESWHGRSDCYSSDKDRGIFMKFGICQDTNVSAIPSFEPLQCLTRHMMLTSHQHLIKDDDAYFARIIRESPEALIMLTGAQEAWARWSYASHWSKNANAKKIAKEYLKTCRPKPGRRTKNPIDPKLLLRAYDDCCTYVRCLYKCAKDLMDERRVLELFPDATALEVFKVKLSEITNRSLNGPEANEVASEYIGSKCGVSADHVINLNTKTRKASRQAKD